MYFRGLGSANQLAVDMPNQTVQLFYGITPDLGVALTNGGKPQRPYNFASYNVQGPQWGLAPQGYYVVTQFMGGFLLDGCPLNVIFGQGFQPGQQAALASANITCSPNAMVPVVQQTSAGPIPGSTTVNAATFNSGTPYVNSNPTSVMISPGTGSAAPTSTAAGGPILPTGPTYSVMPGDTGPAGTPATAPDNTLMYVALAGIALLFLTKRKG